jgi:hypothetical protein
MTGRVYLSKNDMRLYNGFARIGKEVGKACFIMPFQKGDATPTSWNCY